MGKQMGNECMSVVVWPLKHTNCLCCLKLPKVVKEKEVYLYAKVSKNNKTTEQWQFIWINNTTKQNILYVQPWNSNANLGYWHAPPSLPPMACEHLAAIHAALQGSGVRAKTCVSSDKWARQDIFTETLQKPPRKTPSNSNHFPRSLSPRWKSTKSPKNFLFIFLLFIHKSWSNPALPAADRE